MRRMIIFKRALLGLFYLLISFGTGLSVFGQIRSLEGKEITIAEIDDFIRYQSDSLQIVGLSLAFIENGKIAYYRVSGEKNNNTREKVNRKTLFEAASMTKPVFAYTVHKLVEKGLFSIDTPLYKYFPYEDIAYDDRYKRITGRMALAHTTGMPNWRPKGGKLTIDADPGSKYIYSGEAFEFLGYAVQQKTGKKLQDIIREEVFKPLKMNHSFLVENNYVERHMSTGHKDNQVSGRMILPRVQVAYGLRTEATDYARFVMHLMKESQWPNSTFNVMAVPQVNIDEKVSSCLGIRSEMTPYGMKYFHGGNNGNRFQSHFAFFKEKNIGFVFFMNCNKGVELTERIYKFLEDGK